MSEFRGVESRRATGGTPITLEEYRRRTHEAPPAPARGTRTVDAPKPPLVRWWDHGACLEGHDPKGRPWRRHPVWTSPHKVLPYIVDAAVEVCAMCPVRAQCADGDDGMPGIRAGKVTAPFRTALRVCKVCSRTFVANAARSQRTCSQRCSKVDHRLRVRTPKAHGPDVIACFPGWTYEQIAQWFGTEARTVRRWAEGVGVSAKTLTSRGLTADIIASGWRPPERAS